MGSENDKKRLDVEVDRLSSLPDDLIHKILSFNDTLDAVRTSTLSSRWRFIWTTMTCLAFSSEDFPNTPKFSKFVKHVLSGRDNQREVSSVKVIFRRFLGEAGQVFIKRILNYAFSHNVQQLDITCLIKDHIEFPLSLFSSQTLKHLNFKGDNYDRRSQIRGSVILTSTWEVPALTTLHLDRIMLSDNFSGLISKCVNLKNLTLTSCEMVGSNNIEKRGRGFVTLTSTWEVPALTTLHLNQITLSNDNFNGIISKCVNLKNLTLTSCFLDGSKNIGFKIFHSQLSNLTIERGKQGLLSVVTPQLKNLIIRRCGNSSKGIMISAPELAYLLLHCNYCLKVSADDFHSLEKADISISEPYGGDPQNLVGLFQLLHSVKYLTLNLEIIEHLSSSVEILSHQPSPFANLMSLNIYPLKDWLLPKKIINTMEVENYLLDGSPGATFTMISREEIIAERNATFAKKRMAKLQVRLEQEKDDIEANRTHIEQENVPMESHDAKMDEEQNALDENQLQIEGNVKHINSCWESLGEQIKQGKKKIDDIVWELRGIKNLITKLPASNRAEMQPCFSSLCAQADIVMSMIRDSMKIQLDENQSRLNVCFHELTETLQSCS